MGITSTRVHLHPCIYIASNISTTNTREYHHSLYNHVHQHHQKSGCTFTFYTPTTITTIKTRVYPDHLYNHKHQHLKNEDITSPSRQPLPSALLTPGCFLTIYLTTNVSITNTSSLAIQSLTSAPQHQGVPSTSIQAYL